MAQIERLERRLTAIYSYEHMARYYQIVAQVTQRRHKGAG